MINTNFDNASFEKLLPLLTNEELNKDEKLRQKVLRFAFSKERYLAVLLQDGDITPRMATILEVTREKFAGFDWRLFRENMPSKFDAWSNSRMESSDTLTTRHLKIDACREQWLSVQEYIFEIAEKHKKGMRLEFTSICKAHLKLTKGEVDHPGKTRDLTDVVARVGGEWNQIFCLPAYLGEHLEEFESWINSELENSAKNPILLAAQVYQKFVTLHPFENGNGRMARFMMDYVLVRNDLPPPILNHDILDGQFTLKPVRGNKELLVEKIIIGMEKTYNCNSPDFDYR